MNEQWQELKKTITELRDNDGTGTQQEVCKFLANLMDILEKQMEEHETVTEFADRCRECGAKYGRLLKQQPCEDCISRAKTCDYIAEFINHEYSTQSECEMVNAMIEGIHHLPSVKQELKTDVLDKIRAEIEQLPTKTRINWDGCCPDIDYPEIEYIDVTKNKLLSIIDKYRTEREEKDGRLDGRGTGED